MKTQPKSDFINYSVRDENLFKMQWSDQDLQCRVIPALGAGAAYGVAQGTPAQAPIMAVGFAGFSALFYKVCA